MSHTKDMREYVTSFSSKPIEVTVKGPSEDGSFLIEPVEQKFRPGAKVVSNSGDTSGLLGMVIGYMEGKYTVEFEKGFYLCDEAELSAKKGTSMTKAEYIAFHADCCAKMRTITQAKNADYTGEGDDPFANFTDTETYAGVATERGFLVRMGDKMARIRSFAERGTLQVKDESVEDTLLDLANYCILLAGYIRSSKLQGDKQ